MFNLVPVKPVLVAPHYCFSDASCCSQTSLKVLGFFSVNFCTSSEIISNSPSAVALVKDTISELFQGLPLLSEELAGMRTLKHVFADRGANIDRMQSATDQGQGDVYSLYNKSVNGLPRDPHGIEYSKLLVVRQRLVEQRLADSLPHYICGITPRQ